MEVEMKQSKKQKNNANQSTILIVEDDPVTIHFYELSSREWADKTIIAKNGYDALENFTPDIDVVLLDIGLPGIDGIEVCQILRHKNAGVPIIVISAHVDMSDQLTLCERAGANAVFIKPLRPGSIKHIVDRWLHSKKVLLIQEGLDHKGLYALFGKIGYQLVITDIKNSKQCYHQYTSHSSNQVPFEVILIVGEDAPKHNEQDIPYYQAVRQQLSQLIRDGKSPLALMYDQAELSAMQQQLCAYSASFENTQPLDVELLKALLKKEAPEC